MFNVGPLLRVRWPPHRRLIPIQLLSNTKRPKIDLMFSLDASLHRASLYY
jgi:hypothetical protein